MPIYDFSVPGGKIISLESDTQPTEAQVMEIYNNLPQDQPTQQAQPQPQQPDSPLSRLEQRHQLSPEQLAGLPEGTGVGSGLYVHDRQPGRPEITSAEGFRRAAITQAPTVASPTERDALSFLPPVASGVGLPVDAQSVFLEATAREASKRDLLKKQEEGIGSGIARDVGEVFGTDVLTEQFGPAPSPMVKSGRGLVPEEDASFASGFAGEVAAWYADLMTDPVNTARYNPIEAALEVVGLPGVAKGITKLRQLGKVKEADAVVDVVKAVGRKQASRAGLADEAAKADPVSEVLTGTIVEMPDSAVGVMAGTSKAAPKVLQEISTITDDIAELSKTDPAAAAAAADRFTGKPVRTLRKRDLDALYKDGKVDGSVASPEVQNLFLQANQKGLNSQANALKFAQKVIKQGLAGTDEEVIGAFDRLSQVIEVEMKVANDSIKALEDAGKAVPVELIATNNALAQEGLTLATALSRSDSMAGYSLQLRKLKNRNFSDFDNLISRATAQKGSTLTAEQVSLLAERSRVAKGMNESIDDILVGIANRLGIEAKAMNIDRTGIPEMANDLEISKLREMFGAIDKYNGRTGRIINKMNPDRRGGISGFAMNNALALSTLPKMFLAGADLSSRLRQGIWGHIVAPGAQLEGWMEMMKAAKPSVFGFVDHPTREGVRITSKEYALLSQRKALTGMYEGITESEAARQRAINKFIKALDIKFTGIGDARDPLNVMAGTKQGQLGKLFKQEEQFLSSSLGMFEELLEAQMLGKSSLPSRVGLWGAKKGAGFLKRYGEFSERTFALGLNHDRRNSVIRLLGLEDMSGKEIDELFKVYKKRFKDEEFKRMGDLTNITYGRGNLLDLEKASFWSTVLNFAMFSPRFAVSRFQNIMLPFADLEALKKGGFRSPVLSKLFKDPKGLGKLLAEGGALALDPTSKKSLYKRIRKTRGKDFIDDADDMILRESMLAATRIAAVIGMANLAGEAFFNKELFPTDTSAGSDWLKLRTPGTDTRLDMLGGMQAPVRLLSTLATGKRYNLSGEEALLDKDFGSTRYNEVGRFFRNKMSPQASMAYDLLTGKDFKGDELDAAEIVLSNVTPIILQDMVESGLIPVGDHQLDPESLLVLPAIFGVGYSRIDPRIEL